MQRAMFMLISKIILKHSLRGTKATFELKKQYFWDYIPETEFLEQEDGSYYIRQKYIKGSLLKDVDVQELSLENDMSAVRFALTSISYIVKKRRKSKILYDIKKIQLR